MNSLAGVDDSVITPDEDSAPITTERRDASRSRHVSLKELAVLIDRDRNTISKWLEVGLPYVEKADRALGKAWVFDVAEVVRWLERRSAEAAAEKLGPSSDVPPKEWSQAKSLYIKSMNDEREFAEAQRVIVRVSTVIERVSADYAELRSRLIGIPEAAAAKVERQYRPAVKKAVHDQIDNALKALRLDKDRAKMEG